MVLAGGGPSVTSSLRVVGETFIMSHLGCLERGASDSLRPSSALPSVLALCSGLLRRKRSEWERATQIASGQEAPNGQTCLTINDTEALRTASTLPREVATDSSLGFVVFRVPIWSLPSLPPRAVLAEVPDPRLGSHCTGPDLQVVRIAVASLRTFRFHVSHTNTLDTCLPCLPHVWRFAQKSPVAFLDLHQALPSTTQDQFDRKASACEHGR